jgi:hypothetical protein
MFVDGKYVHGGLGDRFAGIVSMYCFCLCRGIPFKLSYTFPFELTDFLLPNQYDWTVSETEITTNLCEAKFMDLMNDASIMKRLTQLKSKRQIHVYTNYDIVDKLNDFYGKNYTWGGLFKQLFKPTGELQTIIAERKKIIGGDYICAAFRFQNMLGDFPEYDYP